MRAAAGLQVHAFDLEHTHAPRAARWLHAHAAHQLRVGVELGFADPAVAHRVRFGHQAGNAVSERLLVQRLVHVKVQPRVAGGDGAAVHRVRHQRAQQMRGGVETHVGAAAFGVDGRHHACAGHERRQQRRQVGAGRRHMQNVARSRRVLARVGEGQHGARSRGQRSGITRLATAQRVEHRAVEHHTGFVAGQHGGLALRQGGVLAEQFFGHGDSRVTMPRGVASVATSAGPRPDCTWTPRN